MTAFLMIFRRFPKIFQNCSEGQTNVPEHFPIISEDVPRLPKTFEKDPKMFRWYTNEFKYNLRDKLHITEIIDIFTCEDIVSFLWICYHSLYHWLFYNKIEYIIRKNKLFRIQRTKRNDETKPHKRCSINVVKCYLLVLLSYYFLLCRHSQMNDNLH